MLFWGSGAVEFSIFLMWLIVWIIPANINPPACQDAFHTSIASGQAGLQRRQLSYRLRTWIYCIVASLIGDDPEGAPCMRRNNIFSGFTSMRWPGGCPLHSQEWQSKKISSLLAPKPLALQHAFQISMASRQAGCLGALTTCYTIMRFPRTGLWNENKNITCLRFNCGSPTETLLTLDPVEILDIMKIFFSLRHP